MGLKDLIFINEDKKEEQKPEGKTFPNAFPDSKSTGFPEAPVESSFTAVTPASCKPYMESVMATYEKGFDDLNQEGYDFYEYYKSILATGSDNAATYQMAFQMATGLVKGLSKGLLVSQSQFYVTELNKVHQSYKSNGNAKKSQLLTAKDAEESSLKAELQTIESQIQQLEQARLQKSSLLQNIDSKYNSELRELDCKLLANDAAKDKLISSIDNVVAGINTHVK